MSLRWEDERYVRLYTRDTVDWLGLSFEAQGLLALILRKVDRAGILQLGRHGKRGVAIALGHAGRWKVIEAALEELLQDGCVEVQGSILIFRNYMEAQEAAQSDRARQREHRARARECARAKEQLMREKGGLETSQPQAEACQNVEEEMSEENADSTVTQENMIVPSKESEPLATDSPPSFPENGHEVSQTVTPSLAVLSLASQTNLAEFPPSALTSGFPPGEARASSPFELDLPEQPVPECNLGRAENEKQKKVVKKHRNVALQVLSALNEARMRVVQNARAYKPSYTSLGFIAQRLDGGASFQDCLHVIAVWEQEIRGNPKAACWFNHVTPFRADKFAEKLAVDPHKPSVGKANHLHVKNRPTATVDQQFTEADLDRLLEER